MYGKFTSYKNMLTVQSALNGTLHQRLLIDLLISNNWEGGGGGGGRPRKEPQLIAYVHACVW